MVAHVVDCLKHTSTSATLDVWYVAPLTIVPTRPSHDGSVLVNRYRNTAGSISQAGEGFLVP